MANEAKLMAGELKLMAGELKLMAGELKLMAGELKLMAGELKLMAGELKLMSHEARLSFDVVTAVGDSEFDVAATKPDIQDFAAALSQDYACGWEEAEGAGVDADGVAGGVADGAGVPFAGGCAAVALRPLRPYRLPRLSAAVDKRAPAIGLFVAA